MQPMTTTGKHPETCYPPETRNTRKAIAKWKQLHKGSSRQEAKRKIRQEASDAEAR